MKCEKCHDVGIIDLDKAGLFSKFCDCEIGKAILEKKRAIYGIPEDKEVLHDSNDRTEPDNTNSGSGDTSEPERTRKSKKKKATRKRAS